jgi:thiamine-monophosphate kinase
MIGSFAVEIAMSDVAAMGGKPLGLLCGYAMPPDTDIRWLRGVSQGMAEAAEALGTTILGGDTKASPEPTIAATALGLVAEDECMYRRGARDGDLLLLTGPVGGPAMGFTMERGPDGTLTDDALGLVYGVHARVQAGMVLAASGDAHACIDLSDGFAPALGQLLEASSVGAEVVWEDIPLASGLEDHTSTSGHDLRELALHWGGEYELLVAVDPQGSDLAIHALTGLGLEPAVVGRVTEGRQTIIIDEHGREVLRHHGFDHFRG